MGQAYGSTYNKDIISSKGTAALIGVVFFVFATALGAYIRIPVPGSPVPITMQTFFVLLAGAVLGKRLGAISQIAYIALGVTGLPVLQGAGFGIPYLLGPTGGYLAGFVAAAYISGLMSRSGRYGAIRSAAIFFTGSVVIYVFGAAWLMCVYGMTFTNAFLTGILPFIPGDITKVLLAAVIYSGISERTNKIFPA
jgi:biotin transport system substrate-specific component